MTSKFILPVIAFWLPGAAPAVAQYNPFGVHVMGPDARAGRFESYLVGQYWNLEKSTIEEVTLPVGPGPTPPLVTSDLTMDFDDTGLFGFGLGYHLNNNFALRGEFQFGSSDYSSTHAGAAIQGRASLHSGRFSLDYNILEGPVTPVVSAGLGYLFIDSGIPNGPPDYYCWWDYWWGYTCTGAYPTHTRTFFQLHAAAGMRWDINQGAFLMLNGGAQWLDTGGASGWLMGWQATLGFGWSF